MDKKYLYTKLNYFKKESIKENEILKYNEINLEKVLIEPFVFFLKSAKKQTQKNAELINLLDKNIVVLKKEILLWVSKHAKKILKKQKEEEVLNALEALFRSNENKRLGTIALTKFYGGFGIKYGIRKEYLAHSVRITKLRKIFRYQSPEFSDLISGKIMSEKIGFEYDNKKLDNKKIDGWCYTKNLDWLNDYYNYHINNCLEMMESYEGLNKKIGKKTIYFEDKFDN